jgi:hypothetical protein
MIEYTTTLFAKVFTKSKLPDPSYSDEERIKLDAELEKLLSNAKFSSNT